MVHIVKAMVFLVVMYGCASWTIKKAECWSIDAFWTLMLEKTLESPLHSKKIKPVNPKGNQPWIFIGRTDAEAEAPIVGPLDSKSQLIRKDPDAGKDWRQEEKGMTEDEMVGWHHRLGHESEQAPGDGERQGSLVCCSPWGHRVRHNWVTKQQYQHPFSRCASFPAPFEMGGVSEMGTEASGCSPGVGGAFPGELRRLLIQLLILPGGTCQGWWSGKTVGVWDVMLWSHCTRSGPLSPTFRLHNFHISSYLCHCSPPPPTPGSNSAIWQRQGCLTHHRIWRAWLRAWPIGRA